METYIYFAMAATISRLVPLAIGARRWEAIAHAGRLLCAFIALSFAGDVVQFVFARMSRNNQWVSHLLIAVQTPVLLLAFADWAGASRLRRILIVTAVAAVGGWLVLTLAFESSTRFARVTGPIQAALFCVAAIAVLVRRGLAADAPLVTADWFWVGIAVLGLYGLTAVYRPLLDLFTARGVTAIPAWTVLKALVLLQVTANLLYARGLYVAGRFPVRTAPAPA